MFLRITALIMLLLIPFYGESVLSPTDRYELKDAETDINILKSILARKPGDLQTLKRLINLTFTLELFDQTEKYCGLYLAIKPDSETAYLKITATASQGKYKSAADQIDPFIAAYKSELSSKDIFLLKYREGLYRKSTAAAGYPSGSVKTSWGDNLVIKTLIPRDGIITAYDNKQHIHKILKINGGSATETVNYPDYLSDTPPESIISVSLSPDGREVIAALYSGNAASIFTKVYLPDKKKWSSWDKSGCLNPGKWNHYPNFVNSSTVIFSSSDGENYDIYITHKDEDGDWREPQKLAGINTPLDEISVFIHPDGETVYFSSNGYEGHGGFDIFSAKLKHKDNSFEITDVKNVSTANTFRNEKFPLYSTLSGNTCFYNFTAGKNHFVYSCPKPPVKPVPVFYYSAEIDDETSGKPVKEAVAEYKSQTYGFPEKKPVYSDGFTGTVLRKNIKYTLAISAEGYEAFSKTIFYTGQDDTVSDRITLKKLREKPVKPVTTLIIALEQINCEESAARPLHELLEMKIGLKQVKGDSVKNILSYTPCGDISCAVNDGKAVKAEYVVLGTLSKTKQSGMKTLGDSGEDQYLAKKVSQTVYTLELKLLETATGKVLTSHKKSTANMRSLKNITQEFIRKTESVFKENK